MSERKPMRVMFGEALCALAKEFPNLVVLDSDVSSSTQTKLFGDKYPDRFYNCGIAEGNMVGIAAGMAAAGMLPVAATFAFLITLRAGDDLRMAAYNNLNVKLAGGYCGLSDFADGASHQSIEDLGVARSIPNLTVLSPSDLPTTAACVRAMLLHEGPVYLRLSREAVGVLHSEAQTAALQIGKALCLREGSDVTLAASGSVLEQTLAAAERLAELGVSAEVLEYCTIKPFDSESLAASARKTGAVLTVEEHNIIGGLGSAAAEALGEWQPTRMRRVGIRDSFGESGKYPELLEKYGLSAERIVEAARELLGR